MLVSCVEPVSCLSDVFLAGFLPSFFALVPRVPKRKVERHPMCLIEVVASSVHGKHVALEVLCFVDKEATLGSLLCCLLIGCPEARTMGSWPSMHGSTKLKVFVCLACHHSVVTTGFAYPMMLAVVLDRIKLTLTVVIVAVAFDWLPLLDFLLTVAALARVVSDQAKRGIIPIVFTQAS